MTVRIKGSVQGEHGNAMSIAVHAQSTVWHNLVLLDLLGVKILLTLWHEHLSGSPGHAIIIIQAVVS